MTVRDYGGSTVGDEVFVPFQSWTYILYLAMNAPFKHIVFQDYYFRGSRPSS